MTATSWTTIKFYTIGSIYALLFICEFAAGFRQDSPALISDAYFNFFTSCVWFLYGTKYSTEPVKNSSYGSGRKDPFGKIFIALVTAALYFSNFMESIQFLFSRNNIPSTEYMIELTVFGGIGITLNIICCILVGASMECLYEERDADKFWVVKFSSELITTINNMTGSMLVLACGLLNFWLQGRFPKCILDGIVGMLIIVLQSHTIWSMTKQNAKVLLQCTPKQTNVDNMKKQLLKEFSSEILGVHELHLWKLKDGDNILTAHLVLTGSLLNDKLKVNLLAKDAEEMLRKMGAHRVTLQFEFSATPLPSGFEGCLSVCPGNDKDCGQQKCCITIKEDSEDVEVGHGHAHAHDGGHNHSHGHASLGA
ncbi:hypothetical protein HDE_13133 [Halotydeus destructor]|nr:hypothetical protein HDE_13133 [Halotydeus destructor]